MKSAPFYLVGTLAYFARWRRLLNEGSYLFIFQILGQAFSKVQQGHAGNFSRVGKGLQHPLPRHHAIDTLLLLQICTSHPRVVWLDKIYSKRISYFITYQIDDVPEFTCSKEIHTCKEKKFINYLFFYPNRANKSFQHLHFFYFKISKIILVCKYEEKDIWAQA